MLCARCSNESILNNIAMPVSDPNGPCVNAPKSACCVIGRRNNPPRSRRPFLQFSSMPQVEAAKYDLNYIGLTGNIGCMGKKLTGRRDYGVWVR